MAQSKETPTLQGTKIDTDSEERKEDFINTFKYGAEIFGCLTILLAIGVAIFSFLTWLGYTDVNLKWVVSILSTGIIFLLLYLVIRDSRLRKIKKEKNEIGQQLVKTKNEVEELNKKLEEVTEKSNKMAIELKSAEEKIADLTSTLKTTQENLENYKLKCNQLTEVIKTKDELIAKMETMTKEKEEELKKLERQRIDLYEQKSRAESNASKLEQEINYVRNEKKDLSTKLSSVEFERNNLVHNVTSYRNRPILQLGYDPQKKIFRQATPHLILRNIGASPALSIDMTITFNNDIQKFNGRIASWNNPAMAVGESQSIFIGYFNELATATQINVEINYTDQFNNPYRINQSYYLWR